MSRPADTELERAYRGAHASCAVAAVAYDAAVIREHCTRGAATPFGDPARTAARAATDSAWSALTAAVVAEDAAFWAWQRARLAGTAVPA